MNWVKENPVVRGRSGTVRVMCCAEGCNRPSVRYAALGFCFFLGGGGGGYVQSCSSKYTSICYLLAPNPQVFSELKKVTFIMANTCFKILRNFAGRKNRPKALICNNLSAHALQKSSWRVHMPR